MNNRIQRIAGVLRFRSLFMLLLTGFWAGCSSTVQIDDPMVELQTKPHSPSRHLAAMEELDASTGEQEEAYLKQLHRMVWAPEYTVDVREAAVRRLAERDLTQLKRTLRLRLPNMSAWEGRRRLCELIAEYGWIDLTPALTSAWAVQIVGFNDEWDRPEAITLSRLHGRQAIPDVLFDLFVESNRVSEQGLRTRCWDLLHRLGYRDRLVDLLQEHEPPENDAMLIDLHVGARELGVVPHNREEILWMRTLRKPEHAQFWQELVEAIQQVPESRRAQLDMRDLPIVVSAARHQPQLLSASESEMYQLINRYAQQQRHHDRDTNFDGDAGGTKDRLYAWKKELTWGDLAAMLILVQALETPEVVAHLFDYAQRDQSDESTEYGGVFKLDHRGRYEILEFPPRIRRHDQEFNASQEMFDAGYTALFHFHYHVQRANNSEYAGPGFGDKNYATNTRANCVVFTSVHKEVMNVDFYRYGGVTVDLGEITQ